MSMRSKVVRAHKHELQKDPESHKPRVVVTEKDLEIASSFCEKFLNFTTRIDGEAFFPFLKVD